MDRRTTLRWMLAAAALPTFLDEAARGASHPADLAVGYGTDPDLVAVHRAGEWWPLLLTAAQKKTARALCDLIIPADAHSPAASDVGVVDFIDEWVSAPYPQQVRDLSIIRDGFEWINARSRRRFGREFAMLEAVQQRGICDAICNLGTAAPVDREAAVFFSRFRTLTAGGFYSTPIGRHDLGYIGNVAMAKFEGPALELLVKLGLA